MFFQKREQTRKVIADLQTMACAYSIVSTAAGLAPATTCDCKYGGTNLMQGTENGNGCPELRSVEAILSVMTDREWSMLVKRVAKKDAKKLRTQLRLQLKKEKKKKS